MSAYDTISQRRFYRSRDRALVAGVCAGLADYFGFNLKVTRILAFISLLLATPTLCCVSALASALALNARRGGVLLSLIILPLYVPVLVFGSGEIMSVQQKKF